MIKILIAAGGTGGHIYPALAIADELARLEPSAQIEFAGTAHGLENKIIPSKGYHLHHLPIGRLNSNVALSERLKTLLLLPFALLKSFFLILRLKPDFVLGVGGYASGPVLLVAALLNRRTAIWEPNAMPGMANRILSRFVNECWVVFAEAKAHLHNSHLKNVGMPVRREIEDMSQAPGGVTAADGLFRLLVFGGSQGARGINNAMVEVIRQNPDWAKRIRLVHQTGPTDFARIREAYGQQVGNVELKEYLDDMAKRYAWADLVICRSGTGTLSELAACGKPAILIPFPFASDDHQMKNAESLVQKGAAEMILQPQLSVEGLKAAIDRLSQDAPARLQMASKIRAFHQPHAGEKLARLILERVSSNAAS